MRLELALNRDTGPGPVWLVAFGLAVMLLGASCGSTPITPTEPPAASPTRSGPQGTQLSQDQMLAQLPRGTLVGRVVDGSGKPAAVGAGVVAIGVIAHYEPDDGVGYGVGEDGTFVIPRMAAMTWTVSINDLTKEPGDPRYVMATALVVIRGGETTRVTIVIDRP